MHQHTDHALREPACQHTVPRTCARLSTPRRRCASPCARALLFMHGRTRPPRANLGWRGSTHCRTLSAFSFPAKNEERRNWPLGRPVEPEMTSEGPLARTVRGILTSISARNLNALYSFARQRVYQFYPRRPLCLTLRGSFSFHARRQTRLPRAQP